MDKQIINDSYVGLTLGERYEILERIGFGGMAYVYKALDHKLGRNVAIKILKDELASDEEFRERFSNESRAVAMLSHTNIVSIYDVSVNSDLDYIVMEYVDGLTLREYVQTRGGMLDWKEALHFTAQIAKALAHAHSRGVIHRDIKPQNIMLLGDSTVKVMDFGIAQLSANRNTLSKKTLGSVHYISPEQATGSSTIDERADIYSLGVVLYELLTGHLPFEGDEPIAVALQHVQAVPLPPRELNPDIPPALERIVLKMMAPDPSDRYQSATALFEALENFRRHPNAIIADEEDSDDAQVTDEPDEDIPEAVPARVSKNERGAGRSKVKKQGKTKAQNDAIRLARRNTMLTGIFLALIFIVGIGIFLWNFLLKDMFISSTQLIEVPDWTGASYEAVFSSEQYKGYFTFVRKFEESETIPEGNVISQVPVAGREKIKTNEPIEVILTVSSGTATVEMPDLYNVEYRVAETRLKSLGLSVADPEWTTSDTIAEGYIVSTYPVAGEICYPNDTIRITVSSGPLLNNTMVPNLIGKTVQEATALLDSLNLTLGDINSAASAQAAGTIVQQSREANEEVLERTKINLTISDGTLAPGYVPPPEGTNTADPNVSPLPGGITETTPDPNAVAPPYVDAPEGYETGTGNVID
ncbi:MAG: Stk1 family PASTA domain-containing Ser/Thr kinase [Oscillospiraceae bacterium]|jgi:serine/threonine-protein kinase|nr:Stk1 family PASTA domain-containing Ser/Thr kinase [Oscillospiraceae bacterium]